MRSITLLWSFQKWMSQNYMPERSQLLWFHLFTLWVNKHRGESINIDMDILLSFFSKTINKTDMLGMLDDLEYCNLISLKRKGKEFTIFFNHESLMELNNHT